MKYPSSLIRVGTALGVALSGPLAQAVTYFKANNAANLNTAASWLDETGEPATTAPVNSTTSSDILIWDARVIAENIVSMGNHIGFRTVRILDPGGAVTINGNLSGTAHVFTVTNGGGIDMSSATRDLTFGPGLDYRVASSNANITHNVAAERTLTINSEMTVRLNSSGVTVNHPGAGTTIYNGPFEPSHAIIGAGEVQFNNPTGSGRLATNSTTVNGGRLVVNNTSGSATGSGAVTINDTATLTGQGIIGGSVTLNSGATLAPGLNGIGTMGVGSLALTAGSAIHWEALDADQADLIEVSANNGLTIDGGTIHLFNPGTTEPFTGTGAFNLISYNGGIGGAGIGTLTVAESSKIEGRTYTVGIAPGFVTLRIETESRPESFWNVNADGAWTVPANWTENGVPNAALAIANLGGAGGVPVTAPRTVTLNSPVTVGVLNFDSAQPFTLAGGSLLTFDDGEAAATLRVKSGSHVISAPLDVSADGLFASIDPASTLTVHSEVVGDAGISKSGGGTLILTADNFYTGVTSNGSGVLQLGAGGATGSVWGPIANSGTLRIDRSDAFGLDSPISGTGSVEFVGIGTTTLLTPNTYSGGTTISAGTVEIADPQAFQNSTLTHSTTGGSIVLADFLFSVTLGGLAGDAPFPLTTGFGDPVGLEIGQNNASTTYTGSTLGTGTTFTKSGTGALALSGTHVFDGNATIGAGTLSLEPGGDFTAAAVNLGTANTARLLINGGTLHSSAQSLVTNASIGIEVIDGTGNFNGGIITDGNNDSGGSFIRVTGGTLNASSLSMSRGSLNIGINAEPPTGQTGNGLYINGGAVNISGPLNIGTISGSNSSVSARMDSGSLTVDGPVTVGINNLTRWSVFDIAGGVFTSTDAGSGVRIGSAFNGNSVMLVRGSDTVVHAERIQFGQADFSGRSILHFTGGEIYLGAGGMAVGSTDPGLNPRFRFGGGILGASADWESSVPISLTGSAVVTAADASDNPHTITLGGSVDGQGNLAKSGSGTVNFTSPDIAVSGTVSVESGTLGIGGAVGVLDVQGGTLAPHGTLNAGIVSAFNGTLAFNYDAAAPGRLHSEDSLDSLSLGATAALVISGTGAPQDAFYILASAASGISGTFANVTGIPAGYTLDYNFDDGSGVPVIALVGELTPYDSWAASFGLSGPSAGPNADPDGDGLKNLIEYALGRNPVIADGPGVVLGRDGEFLTLTFDHIADATLTFAIETSEDLSDPWQVVHTYPAFATAGTVTFTDTVAVGANTRRFLRLRVSRGN